MAGAGTGAVVLLFAIVGLFTLQQRIALQQLEALQREVASRAADAAQQREDLLRANEAITAAKRSDLALLGIGTITDENYSSLYQGGHITLSTIEELREVGAVGDVSALHFDVEGNFVDTPFHDRLVGIGVDDLMAIPVRFAVAGSHAKVEAILGSLRGGWVNQLVIDSSTAEAVLALDQVAELEA